MSDDLVFEMLRAIRSDLAELQSDATGIKERLGLLEGGYASLFRRVDRMTGDVKQIKRRLDIVDAPAGL